MSSSFRFVSDPGEYERHSRQLSSLRATGASAGLGIDAEQPLSKVLQIDGDLLFIPEFYVALQGFLRLLGDEQFFVASVDPSYVQYFFEHFGLYPVLALPTSSSPDQVLQALTADPGGSPADAIAYAPDELALYSPSGGWLISRKRNSDDAIAYFHDSQLRDAFRFRMRRHWINDTRSAN